MPTPLARWDHCPRREGFRYVDLNAEEDDFPFWNPECGSHSCPFCIRKNVWKTAVAIEQSAPERYAVFTGLPSSDWQKNRTAVNALIRAIRIGVVPGTRVKWTDPKSNRRRSFGWAIRCAYTIEAGKQTGMVHVNLLWHGEYIPQTFLSETAEAIGWGKVVHVQDVRNSRSKTATAKYGLKEAGGVSAYGLKEAKDDAGQVEGGVLSGSLAPVQAAYLERNGGQLVHASRGFWRDGPGGETLTSGPMAFRAAMRERDSLSGEKAKREVEWVLTSRSGEVMAHRPLRQVEETSVVVTLPEVTGESVSALLLPFGA